MDRTRSLTLADLFAHHPRRWEHYRFVYPVLSRRARGLSIGINLNPDGACNFDCVYCSVDRSGAREVGGVDLNLLRQELRDLLQLSIGGDVWKHPPFDAAPPEFRRVSDIAFSGDGEPTTCARFPDAVAIAIEVRQELAPQAGLVLITNATLLDRESVRRGLQLLDGAGGEVWAKLDAGTEAYYRLIDRSRVPLEKVLGNLRECGRQRPLLIQTMLIAVRGEAMTDAEFDAYLTRLEQLQHEGCRIRGVQLYTIARRPAEHWVGPLDRPALERFAARLAARLPSLPVTVHGSGG